MFAERVDVRGCLTGKRSSTHILRGKPSLHLVGFVLVLLPRALLSWELAAAVATKTAVALLPSVTRCGSVEFGKKLTILAINEPRRTLAFEDSGCLKQYQATVAL